MQYLKERTNKEHSKNSFFETKIFKGRGEGLQLYVYIKSCDIRSCCNKVWVSTQQVKIGSIHLLRDKVHLLFFGQFFLYLGFRIIKYKMLLDYNRYKIISVKHGG